MRILTRGVKYRLTLLILLYSVKHAMLDTDLEAKMKEMDMGVDSELCSMPWLSGKSMKLPMRLQCDLLVVGDLIGLTQLKNLYRYKHC